MIKKESIASDDQPHGGNFERELLEHLKALHQSLLEENRQLRELLAAQQGAPAPRHGATDDYLTQWEQRRRREAERSQAELIAGAVCFRVSHPGDPQCLVGADSRSEAISKYRRHFGILRSNHEFTVDDVPATAAEPACLAGVN